MGGSSLAPEVITAAAGVPLTVLDGTDPDQVWRVTRGTDGTGADLARTVVVVSSKSGSTVETDSQRRAFEAAFTEAGIDPASRFVVVTDPGSELGRTARDGGYRAVVEADPTVGGRYSALTAFGLVPSGLAGADIGALLDGAAAVTEVLAADSASNPGLLLAAALGGAAREGRDKLVVVDEGSGLSGFGDWAEQLVAESTGKDGTGLLPVVAQPGDPEVASAPADVLLARLLPGEDGGEGEGGAVVTGGSAAEPPSAVSVTGSLGGQMLLWEVAVALAGRVMGINPFDQPDVESAKVAALGLLEKTPEAEAADLLDGALEVRATPGLLDGATDAAGALTALLAQLDTVRGEVAGVADCPTGYLAVMAYLDREAPAVQDALGGVRAALAARTGRPVTFGWAPRFLHSTGQYHKGGPATGVYLQVTAAPTRDLDVPGRDFGFAQLVAAQAAGDAAVLADHRRPVLRLHLADRSAGLAQLGALLTAGHGPHETPGETS